MEKLKQEMIRRARIRYKNIYPCGQKKDLGECFTTWGDEISFWFNTDDHSTRLIICKIDS